MVLLLLSKPSSSSSSSAGHGSAGATAAVSAARFGSFRGGSAASELTHAESAATFTSDQKNGDAVFDDEKRRIYTGPNPLHNR